jgi:signal transduction histidine kinase
VDRIALLGWEPETEGQLSLVLGAAGLEPVSCRDLDDLLERRQAGAVRLAVVPLSDRLLDAVAHMRHIRDSGLDLAVMYLGHRLDPETAVELMRTGAGDCCVFDEVDAALVERIKANLERAKEQSLVRKVEYEQLCVDVENHQIMNWRAMYASKEIVQTEHLIHEMATNINSTGGYEWLDLLMSMAVDNGNNMMEVPKDVYDLILESAGGQRKFFEFITFLSRLDKMAITKTETAAVQFVHNVGELVRNLLKKHCTTHYRPFRVSLPEEGTWIKGYVCQDMALLERCLRELIINAIKYSPEGTALVAGLDIAEGERMPLLNLWIRNQPRQYQAKDASGEPIVGIPHDLAEQVFDLFYTIEPYPNRLPEEEWTDGAGLYIARKLQRRQGTWISTANGVDYSNFKAEPFIKFNLSIPLHAKREESRCSPKCSPCPFMLLKGKV